MDSREFVDRLTIAVRDAAVSNTLTRLAKASGKKPRQEELDRSNWFNKLDSEGRYLLQSCIRDAVDDAVFGMLCVLDGARAIGDCSSQGRLELYYVSDELTLLSSTDGGPPLHEFFE
jgi:hypothetical protein